MFRTREGGNQVSASAPMGPPPIVADNKHVCLKPRRTRPRDKNAGRSQASIVQRNPPIILDTRLNDTQNKGTYQCDGCEVVYHGPFHGEFIEDTRNLSYEEIVSGWKHGAVDASWFCVKCWMERLGFDSEARKQSAFLPLAFPRRFVTTVSINTPADGASVTTANPTTPAAPGTIFLAVPSTPRITSLRVRLRLGGDAFPHCTTGRTSGGAGHGMPHSSAGGA